MAKLTRKPNWYGPWRLDALRRYWVRSYEPPHGCIPVQVTVKVR